ncbi:flagellar hook-length control protein FliK [Azospirillum agricola]|uniref:flagellar hook-length control protein FliK n=1 Tax=Azospirillum agricola TaxID=1720247 RepID=UPI001AE8A779|nr:flagellar hook-length control protein FliK [Azospirillum agricola]MBP2232410.1 flagellar hook-length control protein FliK [Azospirillum agricola]
MTSLPEVIKAPPRPAASPAAATSPSSANDERQDKDFADLIDEAAGDEAADDSPSRTGSKDRPKDSRPDSIARATVTDTTEPVMVPWLAAPFRPVLPETGNPTVVPGTADAATVTPDGGAAPLLSEAPEAPAAPPAILADALGQGTSDKAGAGQAPAAATPQGVPPAGLPANPAPPQAATPPVAPDASAAAQPEAVATTAPAAIPAAIPAATAQAGLSATPQTAETPEPATDGNADPRRTGRSAGRTAGRAAPDAGKPDPSAILQQQAQQQVPGQAVRNAQPQTNGNPTAELPTSTPSPGNAASSGFDALPALHGQAATQYAAAASGRVAAHTPVMAQLATPLVRVAEAGGGEFHIDLAPAELGRVRVVADVNNGQVTLSVQAENADTLALLRRDLQQLEKALGDSGLKLDNANLQFSLQGDSQSRGFAAFGQGGGNGGGSQGPWRGSSLTDAAAETPPERALRPIDGLVDVTI